MKSSVVLAFFGLHLSGLSMYCLGGTMQTAPCITDCTISKFAACNCMQIPDQLAAMALQIRSCKLHMTSGTLTLLRQGLGCCAGLLAIGPNNHHMH